MVPRQIPEEHPIYSCSMWKPAPCTQQIAFYYPDKSEIDKSSPPKNQQNVIL